MADITPQSSQSVSILELFLNAMFFEIVVMVTTLCCVMRCYHRDDHDPPVSGWIRTFVLDRLSYVVRVRQIGCCEISDIQDVTGDNSLDVKLDPLINNTPLLSDSNDEHKSKDGENDNFCDRDVVGAKLDFLIENIKEKARADLIKQEWRTVGLALDRCLCVFFFISLILVTFSCFGSVPSYNKHIEGE